MRCFVGVPLGDQARAAAAALQQELRAAATIRARWVDPATFHLTLAFLGQVEPDLVPTLRAALADAVASVAPFDAELAAPGAFPSARRPHVLWLGIGDGAAAFSTLAGVVRAGLAGFSVAHETRPFHPHLTLARVRRPGPDPSLAACLEAPRSSSCGASWRVSDVTLFESELGPRGARHRPLAILPLGPPG